jgi:hypothetical protein
MRYNRGLSDTALKLWIEKSLPQRLLAPILDCIPADPCALDIQLREGGVLQVYHGNTSLLRMVEKELGSAVAVTFDEYESKVKDLRPDLKRHWSVDNVAALGESLRQILPMLVDQVEPQYYRNKKEGFWENHLCYSYGRSWAPEKECLIIDRQAVIGFASGAVHSNFYQPIREKHTASRQLLFEEQHPPWARVNPIGDELDLLAINQQRELVCVELKHKSNSGLYYGPFQAAVYRDAFLAVKNAIAADIERLARQKIALGLLPASAANMLPISQLNVHAVLAVAGTPSSKVQRRLEQCLERCVNVEYWQLPDAKVI